jgi:hypothetical protein
LTDRVWLAVRWTVALAFAASVTWVVVQLLPDRLEVSTDVVGYPIHNNFNVNRYFQVYYSVVLLFPLVALAALWLLGRVSPAGRTTSAVGTTSELPVPTPATEIGIAQLMFVGSVYGVAAAVVFGIAVPAWVVVLAVACVYALLVTVLTSRQGGLRARLGFAGAIAAANAFLTSLSVFALYAVASSTRVFISSTGEARAYSWLPLWLALAGTALLGVVFAGRISRASTALEVRRVERDAIVFVAAPVLLFLSLSGLPGPLGQLDMFHQGEWLVPAKLLLDGSAFPWRDLFFIHGLMEDVVRPGLGFVGLERSVWGGIAGMVLLGFPLYWVSVFFLNAYLFRRNLPFLVLTTALLATGITGGAHFRVVLLPPVLLLLAALLAKGTPRRAAAFALALVVLAIMTPEMSYAVISCGGAVLLFEVVHRRPSTSLYLNFRRTLWSAGAGLAFIAGWLGFLATQGAADDFLYYYRTFAPDHTLTGGIPVKWPGPEFVWAVTIPLALIVFVFLYCAVNRRRLHEVDHDAWVMGSLALLVFLYYPKFLNRADAHIYHVYAVAVPLLFYVAFRFMTFVDAAILRTAKPTAASSTGRHPVTLVLACAVLLLPLTSPATRLAGIERRFTPTVADAPWLRELGFATSASLDRRVFADLERLFGAVLKPGDLVFDFANEPALSFFLLRLSPSTRYYHVSMAIRSDTQRDLIEQLSRERPRIVIFDNDRFGLPAWDEIPNTVRHYLLSEYLLNNYKPLVWLQGHLLFIRADETVPADLVTIAGSGAISAPDELYFRGRPCVWGYAPNFLSMRPSEQSVVRAVEVAASPGRSVQIRGWAADPAASRPAKEVLAVVNGTVVERTVPSLDRPDVAAALKSEALRPSGYRMSVPLVGTDDALGIKVFAVSLDGAATELVYGGSAKAGIDSLPSPLLSITDKGRDAIPIRNRGAVGFVDASSTSQATVLELPSNARTTDFRWIEIETTGRFGDASFTLTDQVDQLSHAITFKTLDNTGNRFRVTVANCLQWHGYRGRILYLASTTPVSLVRLIP